jgi:hypothetical protein
MKSIQIGLTQKVRNCFKPVAWSLFEASFQLAQAKSLPHDSHNLRFAELAAVFFTFCVSPVRMKEAVLGKNRRCRNRRYCLKRLCVY